MSNVSKYYDGQKWVEELNSSTKKDSKLGGGTFSDGTPYNSSYPGYGAYVAEKHEDHKRVLMTLTGTNVLDTFELAGFKKDDIDMYDTAVKRLIVNCSGSARFNVTKSVVKVPQGWTPRLEALTYAYDVGDELMLDWKDGDGILLKPIFWQDLLAEIHEHCYKRVVVCCVGGHGRTGTALACMLGAAPSFTKVATAGACVSWLRKNYCKKAIETVDQEDYISVVWSAIRGAKAGKL